MTFAKTKWPGYHEVKLPEQAQKWSGKLIGSDLLPDIIAGDEFRGRSEINAA